MSPLLQERATPAAAQPLQPLPLGEEQQQQLEREDSDSVPRGEDSDIVSGIDLQKMLQDLETQVCV